MSKTSDEIDAHTIAAARAAVEWRVVIYAGREAGMCSLPAASLAHARAGGAILEQRLNNGRQSMVYAVTADGRGVLIPRHLDQLILGS